MTSPSKFILEFQPVPASRARVPRFGKPYYTGRYAKYIPLAKAALEAQRENVFVDPVNVACIFTLVKPPTSKLSVPHGDLDNYIKAILDAATSANLWTDDRLVYSIVAEKRFGPKPSTLLLIWE